ncbi:clpP2 [Symbiodinium natans]|uniref:ClpP2 protein n=1 Tax=Symbiodinium natans TaxID=878477 RepID=A0A812M3Y3_9DINO|nr:clpP2 [Symbiodinium natans]
MPGNCCTIIAWSCAVLRFFRPELFAVLTRVGAQKLQDCECYEITNLLWSIAELSKRQPRMAEEMQGTIQELIEAAASSFLHRGPKAWKLQVLVSALVSLTCIPCKDFCSKWFILCIVQELAERGQNTESTNLLPLVMAFDTLRTKNFKVFQEICTAMRDRRPDFVARYMYGGERRKGKQKKVQGSVEHIAVQ